MTFWLILAAMTAAALAVVAWPFLFPNKTARSGSDLVVYRDQLEEIERDRAAGLIGHEEAEAARLEVSRRLIKAAGGAENADAASPVAGEFRLRRLSALVCAALLVPAGSAALYYKLGTPDAAVPKIVATAAKKPGEQSVEDMIAKVEAHLRANPTDGRSWEVLAPVYMRLGRYDDSVRAWRSAISVNGETSERLENLGESLVAAASGVVTDEARQAFGQALALDKDAVAARYYGGLAALQDGRDDEAAAAWRALLASAPPNASWSESVRQSLTRLEAKARSGAAGPSGAPPHPPADAQAKGEPTPQQMQDAARLPDDQQNEMIRVMVERLAARLKLNGDDPDGWARLVRSYNVIGDPDRIDRAIADARKALAASPVKLAMFEDSIRGMGEPAAAPPPPDHPPVARAPSAAADPAARTTPDKPPADMIQAMVARLADKLKQNGDDLEGWLRLVRSYGVLGDKDKADAAIADARKVFAGDADKLGKFEDGLKTLAAPPR